MAASAFRVLIAGGGIAGIEALFALRDLAGDRVELTLLTPDERFRARPFTVAEPFGLGRPREVPHARIARDAGARWVRDAVVGVDDAARQVRTAAGDTLDFDALVLALGGRVVDAVDNAMSWRPEGAGELFSGLLRDLEGGYSRSVAFVVPPGAVWPLPAYELALMTARHADAMGMNPELSLITPEREPLAFFGREASLALQRALEAVGVRLVTGAVGRPERRPRLHVVIEPAGGEVEVDRVVAVPVLHGPALSGVAQDELGFILTGDYGRVDGCHRTWAAGDGVASPLKLGGLATYQARRVARDIARVAEVPLPADTESELVLDGVLMTGAMPVALDDRPLESAPARPLWWPSRKIASRYLEPYLGDEPSPPAEPAADAGVRVRVDAGTAQELAGTHLFSPSRRASPDEIAALGRRMREYEEGRG